MDIDRLVAVVHTTEATRLPEVSPTLTSRGHEMPAGAILAPERRATEAERTPASETSGAQRILRKDDGIKTSLRRP